MMLRSRKTAVVLGCGPAGLFAVHALREEGWEVVGISNLVKSPLYGAQYLHRPIPGLASKSETIRYLLQGTTDGYRRKVYGPDSQVAVSPEAIAPDPTEVWDIRTTYDEAWDCYQGLYMDYAVSPGDLKCLWATGRLVTGERIYPRTPQLIVSSIPRISLCENVGQHRFEGRQIWASGDAPDLGIESPVPCEPQRVVCNGEESPSWYRVSNIFGHKTAEWATEKRPPYAKTASRVTKPIKHSCSCWGHAERNLMFVGRYGSWTKRVLSDDGYYKVKEML